MISGGNLEGGEPGGEFFVEQSGEELLPRGEIARVGRFEGGIIGLAESGRNGNGQVASSEQDEIHGDAGSAAISIGEGMDVSDAVVEPGSALDGTGDGGEAGE